MSFINNGGNQKMGLVTKLFIKLGLAKDQKQANRRMIIVILICVLLSAYMDISVFSPDLLQFGQKKTVSFSKFHRPLQQESGN